MMSLKFALTGCTFLYAMMTSSLIMCLDNGVGLTPPMGWLAWERFRCITDCTEQPESCIREELFMEMADTLVSEGYKEAGYEYVSLDDCWMAAERDSDGKLQADPERFPSGIKVLADYMHQRGLKFGIYADFGTETCEGYPGSLNHLKEDAETFANWGVDLLKLDGCNFNVSEYVNNLPPVAEKLNATGRPMLLNCKWPESFLRQGFEVDYTEIRKECNIARNHGDIQDTWVTVQSIITSYADNKYNFAEQAGPGFYNDPDMLIIGDFGLSYDEQRVQMALWCMWASPLLMSVDLRTIRPESKALLLNQNAIQINQDPLGKQAKCIFRDMQFGGELSIWVKEMRPHGSAAFTLVNMRSGAPRKMVITLAGMGLNHQNGYDVYEVFDNIHLGVFMPNAEFAQYVNPSGVFFGKAVPIIE